jgi:heterotetrameric sarcosine oxidase delta subunit
MLLIPCPWCGDRPEGEFVCLGEAVPPRPRDPAGLTDAEWADWLCSRRNVRGRHKERWWHVRGCNTLFAIERDTVTHEIAAESERP